jgi:RNA recognition motif-containing protein
MSGRGKSSAARKESVTKSTTPAAVVLKLRLFVGGLGPTVGASDLLQRFAPLGTVHKIDLVEGKKGWDAEEALQRGFAYVDFEASSEASLHKLFSAVRANLLLEYHRVGFFSLNF